MREQTGTGGFTEHERAAMKERAAELKEEAGRPRGGKAAAEELDVLAKIAEMEPDDRAVAERIHAIVTDTAAELRPKLWYGQPAYARNGKAVVFFRSGHVDGERYSTLGFSTLAALDDGSGMWPTSYAVTTLTDEAEKEIVRLVRKAAA